MTSFEKTYQEYITRPGSAELLQYLRDTDFFTAPASTRFHGAHEGGLAEHSVNVWNEICRLMQVYKGVIDVSMESVAIVSLLHDLCKIGCYKTEMRNTKENGAWIQKPYYTFVEDFPYGGHGSKSVFLIQRFMTLTDEEAVAVNCHMGFAEQSANVAAISKAFELYPLAWLLHVADESATYIVETGKPKANMKAEHFSSSYKTKLRRQVAESVCSSRDSYAEEYEQIIALLKQHKIPDQYPPAGIGLSTGRNELGLDSAIYREMIVDNSGYALLANDWIRPLAQWIGSRRCLEIMSGSGALAFALAQNGVDIIATDNGSWAETHDIWFSKPWMKVEKLHCLDAINKYAKERPLIICSWPHMDDDAYYALLSMREANPDAMMIYIGEWQWGINASDKFFEALRYVEDKQFISAVNSFKHVNGINDLPHLIR